MGFMRAAVGVAKYAVKRRRAPPANSRRVRPRTAPRLNLKRSRSATKTITKKRRKVPTDSGGELYTRASYKSGRYQRKTLSNLYKTVRRNFHSNVCCFRYLTPFQSVGGAIPLRNLRGGTAGTYTYEYPIHMYDITGTTNVLGGVAQNHKPGFQVFGSEAPATGYPGISFGQISGLSIGSGTLFSDMTMEDTSGSTLNSIGFLPHDKSTFKWSDIKLICHGAKNFPTKYDISFVTIKRRYLVPELNTLPIPVPGTTNLDTEEIEEFYNYLMKPYTYSTIATEGASKFRKYFKTLKRINFVLQPRDSSDSGSVTPFKEVKIFQKWDRFCKFDWSGDAQFQTIMDRTAPIPQSDLAPQFDSSSMSTTVYPTRRIYMMIRATSSYLTAVPSVPTDWWPTYDISLRTKHEFQN